MGIKMKHNIKSYDYRLNYYIQCMPLRRALYNIILDKVIIWYKWNIQNIEVSKFSLKKILDIKKLIKCHWVFSMYSSINLHVHWYQVLINKWSMLQWTSITYVLTVHVLKYTW